mmetsp:Transcript_13854/g.29124  ORF Transcript_13854/g.29124 Transcript_13854/m.29124 type:complete len:583 (+) Transcript_13854:3-1751(+)
MLFSVATLKSDNSNCTSVCTQMHHPPSFKKLLVSSSSIAFSLLCFPRRRRRFFRRRLRLFLFGFWLHFLFAAVHYIVLQEGGQKLGNHQEDQGRHKDAELVEIQAPFLDAECLDEPVVDVDDHLRELPAKGKGKARQDRPARPGQGLVEDVLAGDVEGFLPLDGEHGVEGGHLQFILVVHVVVDDRHSLLGKDLDRNPAAARIDDGSPALVVVAVFRQLVQKDNDGGDRARVVGGRELVVVRLPVGPVPDLVDDPVAKVVGRESRDLLDAVVDCLLRRRCKRPLPEHDALDARVVSRLRIELEVVDGAAALCCERCQLVARLLHQRVGLLVRDQVVDEVEGRARLIDVLEERAVVPRVQSHPIGHPVVDNVLLFRGRRDGRRRQYVGRVEGNHHHGNVDVLRVLFLFLVERSDAVDVVGAFLVDVDHHQRGGTRVLGDPGHLYPGQATVVGHDDDVSVDLVGVTEGLDGQGSVPAEFHAGFVAAFVTAAAASVVLHGSVNRRGQHRGALDLDQRRLVRLGTEGRNGGVQGGNNRIAAPLEDDGFFHGSFRVGAVLQRIQVFRSLLLLGRHGLWGQRHGQRQR